MANFMPGFETSLQGETYSTWSLGSNLNIPATIDNLKAYGTQAKNMHLAASAVHGNKATITVVLDDPGVINDGAFSINGPDRRAVSMRIDMDTSLNAASFSTRLNKEQGNVSQERLRRVACTLVSIVAHGAPLPEEKKASTSGIHLRNPFKSQQKEAAERLAAVQEKQNQNLDMMRHAQALLYQRAQQAGKAIVFMPMMNVDAKYSAASVGETISGGPKHQAFRFDQTATLVWHASGDPNNLLQAGNQSSLYQTGLFGYIQKVYANKIFYGVFIVDPGSYDLIGLTYDLDHSGLPALSSKQWTEKPALGMASLAPTSNAEFSTHQAWADAQYQNVQVYDGSSCTMVQSGGGVTGCVAWQDQYHNETRMTDAGGWRTAVDKNYAGGLQIALTLTRPFARFEAKPGEVIVTDGFFPSTDSMVIDNDACHQAKGDVVACGIQKLALYRITGRKSELPLAPDSASKSPTLVNLISRAEYRPMTVNATSRAETPGTYEAGWSTPYTATAH
ncbi:hypothetical protein [Dyella sp. C11]|uniref:hypothetical protein n=1 Tax=Dyella sp. C11 TaxID=2126991 RepID=UPI000D655C53|nr:hypothetical protein [Dyella sp. C11]